MNDSNVSHFYHLTCITHIHVILYDIAQKDVIFSQLYFSSHATLWPLSSY